MPCVMLELVVDASFYVGSDNRRMDAAPEHLLYGSRNDVWVDCYVFWASRRNHCREGGLVLYFPRIGDTYPVLALNTGSG